MKPTCSLPCEFFTYGSGQVTGTVDVLHLCPDAQGLSWSVNRHIGIYSQLSLWGERGTRRTLRRGRGRGAQKVIQADREWFPYQTCCLDRCPVPAGWAGALWQLQRPPLHNSCLAPSPAPLDLHLMGVKTAVFYTSKVSILWSSATNLTSPLFVEQFKCIESRQSSFIPTSGKAEGWCNKILSHDIKYHAKAKPFLILDI